VWRKGGKIAMDSEIKSIRRDHKQERDEKLLIDPDLEARRVVAAAMSNQVPEKRRLDPLKVDSSRICRTLAVHGD
jgi:hypothetical protein